MSFHKQVLAWVSVCRHCCNDFAAHMGFLLASTALLCCCGAHEAYGTIDGDAFWVLSWDPGVVNWDRQQWPWQVALHSAWKEHCTQAKVSWILVLIFCVVLGRSFNFSEHPIPHLLNDRVGLCNLSFFSIYNVHDSEDSIDPRHIRFHLIRSMQWWDSSPHSWEKIKIDTYFGSYSDWMGLPLV